MKIRNGFVSNSSSSSFVVVFPREPKSATDVKDILFKDEKYFYDPYDSSTKWTTEKVSEIVWKDICNQKKNDIETALEVMESYGYGDSDAPDYDKYGIVWGSDDYDEKIEKYENDCIIYAKKKFKELYNPRKEKLRKLNDESYEPCDALYIFEYSDNDGSLNCAMEHGNLFNKLKHYRISKH
jgi:hypothetical protein